MAVCCWVRAVAVAALLAGAGAQCHNRCSSHGECDVFSRCVCYEGWGGADCSRRDCPRDVAWVDYATADNQAHGLAECSNRGRCDRATGTCHCQEGYTGAACSRSACPNGCSNHGACMSIAEAALTFDAWQLNRSHAEYSGPDTVGTGGSSTATSSVSATGDQRWDADKIYGCVCDNGWGGADCSQRQCALGDDPRTAGQKNEVALLFCRCPGNCTGGFKLSFMGKETPDLIPHDASNASLAEALGNLRHQSTTSYAAQEGLYSFPPIRIAFDQSSTVCSALGTTTTVAFQRDSGDLPPLYLSDVSKLFSQPVEDDEAASAGVDIHLVTEQFLRCDCGSSSCGGSFQLAMDGHYTTPLAHNATNSTIAAALARLAPLARRSNGAAASVTVVGGGLEGLCSASGNVTIRLQAEVGNLPALTVVSSLLPTTETNLSLSTNDGTTEREVCNAGGGCDAETGRCLCDEFRGPLLDAGACGRYVINTSAWTGWERCAGYVDRSHGRPVIARNTANLWFADYISNSSLADTNQTGELWADSAYLDDELKVHGVHSLNLDTLTPRNHLNLTNATALALDLSKGSLYVADGATGIARLLQFSLTEERDGVVVESPEALSSSMFLADQPEGNTTFPANLSAPPSGLALDLRFEERRIYWSQPSTGQILRAYLEDGPEVLAGRQAAGDTEDLTPTIQASLGDQWTPGALALDLDGVSTHLYWLDPGNKTTDFEGRIFRSALDGSNAELVLDRGRLRSPQGLALDLRNGTIFVAHAGAIVLVDMEYSSYQNPNASTFHTLFTRYTYLVGEVTKPVTSPYGIVFDPSIGRLYWSELQGGVLVYADYDPTVGGWQGAQLLKQLVWTSEVLGPRPLALDLGFGPPRDQSDLYECYGHGTCLGYEGHFRCECFDGFYGNCNMTYCPVGPAWFDEPWADHRAHRLAPCSNAGLCNHWTGQCECFDGFTGAACERMTCPGDSCSGGHGRCLSMRRLAADARTNGDPTPFAYGSELTNTSRSATWDADVVHGCACESYGYSYRNRAQRLLSRRHPLGQVRHGEDPESLGGRLESQSLTAPFPGNTGGVDLSLQKGPSFAGYDCSLRECPFGDNPNTVVNETVEVQYVTCNASNGSFTLSFRGEESPFLSYNATAAEIEAALDSLPSIGDVSVSLQQPNQTLCTAGGNRTATVQFLTEFGDLPLLQVGRYKGMEAFGDAVQVVEAVQGTKEDLPCSLHGLCDEQTGECTCLNGYVTSDGQGQVGPRGDCGSKFLS